MVRARVRVRVRVRWARARATATARVGGAVAGPPLRVVEHPDPSPSP